MTQTFTRINEYCMLWLFLTLGMGGSLNGQNVPRTDSNAGDEAEVSSGFDAEQASLQQLKVIGALRSSYLEHRPREVGTKAPEPQLAVFRNDISPILAEYCVGCHGAESPEGNIRIDTLDPDLLHGNDTSWWLEILAVVSKGEMPPADADKLPDDQRRQVVDWLSSEIQIASAVRRSEKGHSSFRRMTRYETNYALQDLLGVPHNFVKDLPPESPSVDGFQNSSDTLRMSAVQFATYRELSRQALQRATVRGEQPARLYWGITMKAASSVEWAKQEKQLAKIREKHKDAPEKQNAELQQQLKRFRGRSSSTHYKNLKTGRTAKATWNYRKAQFAWKPTLAPAAPPVEIDHVAIIPPRQKLIVELGDRIPEAGTLRIRIRAAKVSANDAHPPGLQLEFGWQASNDSAASVRISEHEWVIDAPPGNPQFYQWDIPLADIYPRNSVRTISKLGDLPSPSEYLKIVNSSVSGGDVQVDYVEVTAPFYRQWPPESHTRIFFDDDLQIDEADYARQILTRFLSRAWRRSATGVEVEQKLALFNRIRPTCDCFQDAMVEVLATALASPRFLYLSQTGHALHRDKNRAGERLSDHELATRLSMFLWCSIPDKELLDLAAANRLANSEVLRNQVERMLDDPRSQRFATHFVRQWLGMQLLDFVQVDRKHYPQFDPMLKEAMQKEPIALFQEVLQNDHSVLDFIHADYVMANERLARHYGLSNIHGNHFRRVSLGQAHTRGGLLTQAGLLAMNSDGKDSHPLKRGIWMLENLLDDPPPPPPPAVPEIDLADPEIQKLTLKQRIENHRNHAACKSCHAKIDPWGIAFENFDAIGNWRTKANGRAVDSTSTLFNNQRLEGMDGLKRFLLQFRQDQFVRAIVHKMTTYALGRPLTFGDRSSIDQMTADLRKQGDGLATMIAVIVAGDLFQSK